MVNEEIPKTERISESKAELLALEKTGKYVFHGAPEDLKFLEPHQAQNKNKETGAMEDCGSPAVYATPYADSAIFAALIKNNAKNIKGNSDCEWNSDNSNFAATQNLLDAARKITGYIYILDKSKFGTSNGEFFSDKKTVPIAIIKVTGEDLPRNINVIE